MAVAGAVALTVGIGPPTSAQLQSCPCAPAASPPRARAGHAGELRAIEGKNGRHGRPTGVTKSRLEVRARTKFFLARHGLPQYSLGKYIVQDGDPIVQLLLLLTVEQ